MPNQIIDPNLLLNVEIPIYRVSSTKKQLDQSHRLVHFGSLSGQPEFADVRIGYDEFEIRISVNVTGKKKPLVFLGATGGRSDGLRVWIDSRSSPNIRRASQYCHCFNFFPEGKSKKPFAEQEQITRAQNPARMAKSSSLKVTSKVTKSGYKMDCRILADAIHGYDPQEFPQIGFFYSVIDAELGVQTLGVSPVMKYQEDPSLWFRARFEN